MFSNKDVPGIIGKIGSILGGAGVNIAGMDVARNKKGGEALTIMRLDDRPGEKTLAAVKKISGISSVKLAILS